jgi:cell division protease FtsH
MSDAARVVNEAARLTARAQQDRITEAFLNQALKRLHSSASAS